MVNSSFTVRALFTGLLALSQSQFIGAAPTSAAPFSFVDWVEDIIADPNGNNLTPEQAVEAFHASLNTTGAESHLASRGALGKRATCYEVPNTEAYLPDAVACVNQLASRGGQICQGYRLCQIGHALITADGPTTSSCNDCARGAGYILDACTRPNDPFVQGSEYAHGNGRELIRIRRPD